MFIAALFIVTKIWKEPMCPSVDEWIKYMAHLHNVIRSAIKKKKKITHFLKAFMYLFLERRREGEERERNLNVWLPLVHPLLGTWSITKAYICPDWESNQQPFGSQSGTQSTEPHQPGQ